MTSGETRSLLRRKALKSTAEEVPGKSPRKFWGSLGKCWEVQGALGKSDSLPATRKKCLQLFREGGWGFGLDKGASFRTCQKLPMSNRLIKRRLGHFKPLKATSTCSLIQKCRRRGFPPLLRQEKARKHKTLWCLCPWGTTAGCPRDTPRFAPYLTQWKPSLFHGQAGTDSGRRAAENVLCLSSCAFFARYL